MRPARLILAVVLTAACVSCQKETWTPYDFGEFVPKETTPARRTVEARLADATSSTLTIQWSVSSFKDGAVDNRTPWKIGLYRDAATTQAVAEWDCSPGLFRQKDSKLKFQIPCFFFTGLEPGTTWYFKAEAEDCSGIFPFETKPFTRKVPDTVPARPGELLLGEDFSEMVWGPHQGIFSVGYAPLHPDRMQRILPVDPASTRADYYLLSNEFILPWDSFRSATRLADWEMIPPRTYWPRNLDNIYLTPLGVQVYGGLETAVVLPPLPALTKPSTVRVRLKTSQVSDEATFLVYTTTAESYGPDSQGGSPGMIPLARFERTGTEGRWSLSEAILHNVTAPYRIGVSSPDVAFVLKEISLEVVDQEVYDITSVIPDISVEAPESNASTGDLVVNVVPTPWVLGYQVDYARNGSEEWETAYFDVWYNYQYPTVGIRLEKLTIGRSYRIRVQGIGLLGEKTQAAEAEGTPRRY